MLRSTLLRLLVPAAVAGALVGALAAGARAGDPAPAQPQGPQGPRPLQSSFLKGMVGDWDTEMTEGEMGKNKGHSTWHVGLGDTAAFEDYNSAITRSDGVNMPWSVHVVVREAGSGKVEGWMFDNMSPGPVYCAGTLTDAGLDVSSKSPQMRITAEKKGDDVVWHMWQSDHLVVTEVYRKHK